MGFWRRLLLLLPWRRRAAELDMQEELQSIASMADPRELGNLTRAAEDARAEWSWRWIDQLAQDIRQAVRGLRIGRGTTALAFAMLTLTLAAGTVTFSVVDAVALRPLPFGDNERLIGIGQISRVDGRLSTMSSPQDYFAWRDGTRSFEGLAAAALSGAMQVEGQGATGEVVVARVTANLFDVLGVRPALGRLFRSDEDTEGRDAVVVLTHTTWTRVFNGDPGIVGRRVTFGQLKPVAYEVIGVLPEGITYPLSPTMTPDVFRPYVASAMERVYGVPSRAFFIHIVGRLRPGISVETATADVDRATAAARAAFGMTGSVDRTTVVLPLRDAVVGPAKSWLLVALAAVLCVVLVGCVNVASLLLARATVRSRELATRAALGASRARLARTLLAESLGLTVAASAAALVLAFWGVEFAKSILPEALARASSIALDRRVLLVSIGIATLAGLCVGGAPAWRVGRTDLFAHVKGGGVVGGRRQARLLGAFLIAELSFVTLLLVATTLAVTTFVTVTTMDLGFDRRNVVAIQVSKPLTLTAPTTWRGTPESQAAAALFFADAIARARTVPGVTHVGMIGVGPAPPGGAVRYSVVIPAVGELTGPDMFETRAISPEYFAAMGLRMIRGRPFTDDDRAGAPSVVIINDFSARRYFVSSEPVGEIITFRGREHRIVGVVQTVRVRGPEADPMNEIYEPLAQSPHSASASGQLVVRTEGSAAVVAAAVREAVKPALGGEPVRVLRGRTDLVLGEPRFIDDVFRRLTAQRRFNASLMSVFGILAVLIGAIGIYGMMAFIVAQETRAIGVRMALGATQARVLRSVLWESLWRVGLGVGLGLVAARGVADLFVALVFGVQTTSLAVYAAVAAGLALVGVLAALVPARRAARIDPLVTLRAE